MARTTLEEIEAIKKVKARYFRFLDAKQWTDWRACFTDDLHFFMGQDPQPVASSADEFVAYVSKLLAGTVTVHHGHMPEIERTGARPRPPSGRSRATATMSRSTRRVRMATGVSSGYG